MDYGLVSCVLGVGLAGALGWQWFAHGSEDVPAAVAAYVMAAVGLLLGLGLFRLLGWQ